MDRCDQCDAELPRDEPRYKRKVSTPTGPKRWWMRAAPTSIETLQLCGKCARELDRAALLAKQAAAVRRGVLLLAATVAVTWWSPALANVQQFKWLLRVACGAALIGTYVQFRSASRRLTELS